MTRFVLASHNPKKLREMKDILSTLDIEVQALPPDAPAPEENGKSFEENALIKAVAACELTGLPALADDSGLCVDALGGLPGIYSARYGSIPASDGTAIAAPPALAADAPDSARTARLLRHLENVPDGGRGAQFVCAIACAWPSGETLTVRGTCGGEIARAVQGQGGFGYDPVFYVPEEGRTFAELSPAAKSRLSHRGRALRALKNVLQTKDN